MPMNASEQTKLTVVTTRANNLEDKKAAFVTAASNKATADQAFNDAKAALDTAYTQAKASETSFDEELYSLPASSVTYTWPGT
jgi:hypothetical protein